MGAVCGKLCWDRHAHALLVDAKQSAAIEDALGRIKDILEKFEREAGTVDEHICELQLHVSRLKADFKARRITKEQCQKDWKCADKEIRSLKAMRARIQLHIDQHKHYARSIAEASVVSNASREMAGIAKSLALAKVTVRMQEVNTNAVGRVMDELEKVRFDHADSAGDAVEEDVAVENEADTYVDEEMENLEKMTEEEFKLEMQSLPVRKVLHEIGGVKRASQAEEEEDEARENAAAGRLEEVRWEDS
jgi:hypothetical protein